MNGICTSCLADLPLCKVINSNKLLTIYAADLTRLTRAVLLPCADVSALISKYISSIRNIKNIYILNSYLEDWLIANFDDVTPKPIKYKYEGIPQFPFKECNAILYLLILARFDRYISISHKISILFRNRLESDALLYVPDNIIRAFMEAFML